MQIPNSHHCERLARRLGGLAERRLLPALGHPARNRLVELRKERRLVDVEDVHGRVLRVDVDADLAPLMLYSTWGGPALA